MAFGRRFALLLLAPLTISIPRFAIGADMDHCPECYDCGYHDQCQQCMDSYYAQQRSEEEERRSSSSSSSSPPPPPAPSIPADASTG